MECKFKDTGHGPCGGPSNGNHCMNHQDCTRGLLVCGHANTLRTVK